MFRTSPTERFHPYIRPTSNWYTTLRLQIPTLGNFCNALSYTVLCTQGSGASIAKQRRAAEHGHDRATTEGRGEGVPGRFGSPERLGTQRAAPGAEGRPSAEAGGRGETARVWPKRGEQPFAGRPASGDLGQGCHQARHFLAFFVRTGLQAVQRGGEGRAVRPRPTERHAAGPAGRGPGPLRRLVPPDRGLLTLVVRPDHQEVRHLGPVQLDGRGQEAQSVLQPGSEAWPPRVHLRPAVPGADQQNVPRRVVQRRCQKMSKDALRWHLHVLGRGYLQLRC